MKIILPKFEYEDGFFHINCDGLKFKRNKELFDVLSFGVKFGKILVKVLDKYILLEKDGKIDLIEILGVNRFNYLTGEQVNGFEIVDSNGSLICDEDYTNYVLDIDDLLYDGLKVKFLVLSNYGDIQKYKKDFPDRDVIYEKMLFIIDEKFNLKKIVDIGPINIYFHGKYIFVENYLNGDNHIYNFHGEKIYRYKYISRLSGIFDDHYFLAEYKDNYSQKIFLMVGDGDLVYVINSADEGIDLLVKIHNEDLKCKLKEFLSYFNFSKNIDEKKVMLGT